jgi:thiamine biosynthesis lipoprotein
MAAAGVDVSCDPAWSLVGVGSAGVAAADRDALGTTARLVAWPPGNLRRLLAVVDAELAALDRQASRFRQDSEISLLHQSGQDTHMISSGLAEAIGIALAAARWTGGLADPTVGGTLIALGYDRDFAAIGSSGDAAAPDLASAMPRVPGWQQVKLNGAVLTMPTGIRLDLGATAKGLGADRAARAAHAAAGSGGVLVSLGGDLAVAGDAPSRGWPLLVADEHRQTRAARNVAVRRGVSPASAARRQPAGLTQRAGQAGPSAAADPVTAQLVRLSRGGLATSSVTCRQWLRAGQLLHHIIDPRTGRPAEGPWRTVSVAAASCAEANAAATAAIIAGDGAEEWLTALRLPARLIGHDGSVRLVGGWPAADGGRVDPPTTHRLPAGNQE